jgi:alkylated DNA repair dioxygenase AlkB
MTQLNLFDEQPTEPIVHRDFHGVSGLSYRSVFVSSHEGRSLLAAIDLHPWLSDLKRRVQHYGYKYDYKARRINQSMHVGPLPDFAVPIARRLIDHGLMDAIPDQLIINEYLPGQGITPHVDCEPCFGNTIVTISLGSAYMMEFSKVGGDESFEVLLEVGSALAFSGEARYLWTHGIKPRKTDHGRPRRRRVSLTFRNVILEAT